jgi:hypothetical protein
VGQQTKLTFTFKTAASPDGDLDSGFGYVNVRLPIGFLYRKGTTAPTCTIRETSSATAVVTTCSASHTTDTLGQEYLVRVIADLKCSASTPCTGGKTYEFSLDGYLNPFNTKAKDGLFISTSTTRQTSLTDTNYEIINVLDQVIGSAVTFLPYVPGTLTVNSLLRTVAAVDASTTLQFDLKLMNRLEKGGYVNVKIPTSQALLGSGLVQYQTWTGSAYGTAQTLTILEQATDHTLIQFKEFCATGTAKFCAEGTQLKFQILGFINIGSVQNSPITFFEVTTLAADGENSIDFKNALSLSPLLTPANIQIVSVAMSTNQAAVSGVVVDFQLKFGARMDPGESITFTISEEFIRRDNGDLTCFLVSPSNQESPRPCMITHILNVVSLITIPDLCSASTCESTSQYSVRIKNAVNKFTSEAYTGSLLIQTMDASSNLIGTATKQMTTQPTLVPGVLQSVSVTRSATT